MPCRLPSNLISFVIACFYLLVPVSGEADIYKFVDDEGVIHLTNVPTESNVKYVLVMKEKPVHFNRVLNSLEAMTKYDEVITKTAKKYEINDALVKAVIKAESNFNHKAVSPKGARGLMQLMPATASSLQVSDSFHPEQNIEGGCRYLRYLLNLYHGNIPLALAAYNAGEGAVARYNSIPPYRETQNYVQRVLSLLDQYNSRN
jgi:soluble lytic murein transglycosylase-like protein